MFDSLWGMSFDEYDDDNEGVVDCFKDGQKNILGYALMKARYKINNPTTD